MQRNSLNRSLPPIHTISLNHLMLVNQSILRGANSLRSNMQGAGPRISRSSHSTDPDNVHRRQRDLVGPAPLRRRTISNTNKLGRNTRSRRKSRLQRNSKRKRTHAPRTLRTHNLTISSRHRRRTSGRIRRNNRGHPSRHPSNRLRRRTNISNTTTIKRRLNRIIRTRPIRRRRVITIMTNRYRQSRRSRQRGDRSRGTRHQRRRRRSIRLNINRLARVITRTQNLTLLANRTLNLMYKLRQSHPRVSRRRTRRRHTSTMRRSSRKIITLNMLPRTTSGCLTLLLIARTKRLKRTHSTINRRGCRRYSFGSRRYRTLSMLLTGSITRSRCSYK